MGRVGARLEKIAYKESNAIKIKPKPQTVFEILKIRFVVFTFKLRGASIPL